VQLTRVHRSPRTGSFAQMWGKSSMTGLVPMTRIYDHGQLAMAPSLDFRSAFGGEARRLGRLLGSLDVD
jgi:hypothetical protein